jgi:alpha-mannosidase
MPDFKSYTRHSLDQTLIQLEKAIYSNIAPLKITAWRTAEPVSFAQRMHGFRLDLKIGESWGGLFDCAWFCFQGQIPQQVKGSAIVLLIDINGELCIYDGSGIPIRGLTNVSSEYDYSLGKPGKRVFPLCDHSTGGETVEIWADAGCNDLFGRVQQGAQIQEAAIAVLHPEIRSLYYDFEVLLDYLKALPADSANAQQLLTALKDAAWELVHSIDPLTVQAAANHLKPLLDRRGGDPAIRVTAIGHSHVDLAWLWPIRETKRKITRTMATVIANMKVYPDYRFGASQAQLFQWLKEDHPALYDQVKARVSEGRFEPQGAMWVEADTNLAGGEALVRQLLLGKHFFKKEFNADINYLWLPDVFGYSAALPQILSLAGVDIFMTQKLSWNQVNRFPHQSFHWQGLNGTRILAHMLPEETYNSPALPRSLVKLEKNYQDSGVSAHALLLYGIGDGGGGPGEEHLERLQRIGNLAGLPPVKQESAAEFFSDWIKDSARFPNWTGELYLERHSGTLTTQARTKQANRRMEQALRQLEWSLLLSKSDYPNENLLEIWREVLLYQFHDILPGSSIKRVYDESLERYEVLQAQVSALTQASEEKLSLQIDTSKMTRPIVSINSLNWDRLDWIEMDGVWKQIMTPSMGWKVVDFTASDPFQAVEVAADRLENDQLRVTFASDGSILSIIDKNCQREVLPAGTTANRLSVYHDDGDAWDFPLDYAQQTPRQPQLTSTECSTDGPYGVISQTYQIGYSKIVQSIRLAPGSCMLEFDTQLVWRETASMLRTSFPVAVHTDEASFEIQFGHIRRPTHRNTTWDLARDEVPCHKWVDLSQRDYGATLINDSKYGCKVKDGVMDLNLLRSVPFPGPKLFDDTQVQPGQANYNYTDQAEHHFRYAFYPHAGDPIQAQVTRRSYEFNLPIRTVRATPHSGNLPIESSWLIISSPEVILEAVKKAEDGPELILRLYENANSSPRTKIEFGFPVSRVEEVTLLESFLHELVRDGNSVEIPFRPFEIKTLRVTPA